MSPLLRLSRSPCSSSKSSIRYPNLGEFLRLSAKSTRFKSAFAGQASTPELRAAGWRASHLSIRYPTIALSRALSRESLATAGIKFVILVPPFQWTILIIATVRKKVKSGSIRYAKLVTVHQADGWDATVPAESPPAEPKG